ncbi:MAG: 1-acyl-sn-glycerol-3-phosphate acyltransferase [Alistipes sp.]|nr:1-acyl-sn-glycerol-3-phosphate acyltransferase [Alistipes sp.]
MMNPFLALYDWFKDHRSALCLTLLGSVVGLAFAAVGVQFEENISSFFDDGEQAGKAMFDNLKLKDRIVVLFSGEEPDELVEAGYAFVQAVEPLVAEGLIATVTDTAGASTVGATTDFVYRYLPLWLEEADYVRMDSLLTREGIHKAVERSYRLMTSAAGMAVGEVVRRDPLSIATHLMRRFERFDAGGDYELYADHLFTADMKTMLLFLSPAHGLGHTGENERLVSGLEEAMAHIEGQYAVDVSCVGGPVVAVYNARQIKRDTMLTLSIALLIIVGGLFLSFRNRRAIPLIVTPPLYGALFSLALIYFIQGSISAIAIGAGAIVLGIALSYSIHVVAHSNHTPDPKRIIEELTYPLTIGCLTTIGAFVALLFTRSALLHDMGLFAALALVGTTLFCLVFLPHFLHQSDKQQVPNRLMQWIEQANSYDYTKNRWVVALVVVLTIGGLFFYRGVGFDSDMSRLNYEPEEVRWAENRLEEAFGKAQRRVYLVSSADALTEAVADYERLTQEVSAMQQEGLVEGFTSVADFVLDRGEQERRIARWEQFWQERRATTMRSFNEALTAVGFRAGAFPDFGELLHRRYEVCGYTEEELRDVPILSDWINFSDDRTLLVSGLELKQEHKGAVYARLKERTTTAIIDRAYFSSRMVETAGEDFNYILFISSLIVFVALLLSYGRIELALLAFLPMCITWVIILGMMALFDIRFNIVNVILATFIFGIGDDFSIFIMDGLLEEYRTGRKMLGVHKTAIFFSAFTTVVGMGVLILAEHPALKSIALISVLGMMAVVLVSYTLQPLLFRLLVRSQTQRGSAPYTLRSLLVSLYAFLYFFLGCVVLQLLMAVMQLLPMQRKRRKAIFHHGIYHFTRLFLKTVPGVRLVREGVTKEAFDRPAVIVANHQSFIDILMLLSTTPRLVMVTNSWVWHSPFFGRIVRYADCYHVANGYEQLSDELRPRIEEGYSVVIFPEGTRSVDQRMGRFHKGAFYLADMLKLDIVPVLLYGTGMVSAKRAGFHIKRGWLVEQLLPRISYGDKSWGATYREQAKIYRRRMMEGYAQLNHRYGVVENPYFRDTVQANYLYKGPVLEGYMRVKMRLDGYYRWWHKVIPARATVTDVGCGHGQMACMLSLLGPDRTIYGLDYDAEKILQAQHSFLASERLQFRVADMRVDELPRSDVFLFNDSLHYISAEGQRAVLQRAVQSLNEGGMIIVRDGDASRGEEQHAAILATERWSTRILKFNRTDEHLHFVDRNWMAQFAREEGLYITTAACDTTTSETLYLLTKTEPHG